MTVRQAANALQILEYFATRLQPATAAEIAQDLGWPRSSTFKLVSTLAEMGFLYEPRARSGYYPSPRWLELAERVTQADPLPPELHVLVRNLVKETGETTLIAAPSGEQAIFLEVQESPQPVRYFANAGDLVPIHASSAGRALMEQMSAEERIRIYRKATFERFSGTSPASPHDVEHELVEARKRGFHRSNSEYVPDLAGVALPLPWRGRRLSIVVVGPLSRCLGKRAQIAEIIRRQIAGLEKAAG